MDPYFCGRKRKYDIILETNTDEKETTTKKSKSDPFAALSDTNAVESYRNHIYFYCGVSKKTCLKLNIELKKTAQSIIDNGKNLLNKDKYIYLHINSFGGSVFAALSTIDTIMNLPVPVVSIIEGAAASAATMISVVCNYRIIYPNSYMLIHQLSSSCWGQMDDLEEEMGNLRELMDKIKSLYKKNTKINEKDLDEILKHDIWWGADKCLESGLVDRIHESKPVYEIDEDKIDL
jgi:ATP-dependent protease ClpP protease subunit